MMTKAIVASGSSAKKKTSRQCMASVEMGCPHNGNFPSCDELASGFGLNALWLLELQLDIESPSNWKVQ
jgi:hypothetical protein